MNLFVHVVDDDESFRKSVGRLLRACGFNVKEYESAQAFLAASAEPGCILLDVRMRHMGGLELQERLGETASTMPIVFLSGHADVQDSVRAMKAGAEDFLSKPTRKAELVDAITRAFDRHRENGERKSRSDALHALLETLTPRQRQVFTLVAEGKLNKQIAHELSTTERTIKAHRQKVMSKLQVKSFAELITFAEHLKSDATPAPSRQHESGLRHGPWH
jgi:RNA polymerase sigma factor (sigma-70 family)